MRIRTQFITTMLLFGAILVVVATSVIMTSRQAERAGEQERIAANIAQGASELGYLTNDYLVYRERQQLKRWRSRFVSLSSEVASLKVDKPEQKALVSNILANEKRFKEVFDSVASDVGGSSQNQRAAFDTTFFQVSWSRMAVQSQGLVSDASRLSQQLRAQADRLKDTNMVVILAMMGIFGAYFLINYWMIQRRSLKSIATLQAGVAIIGSGNLDFKIHEKKNDEIGDLSRAFNRMSASLKEVTASKADLEKEIVERKKAEANIRRQNAILEAINRILHETVTCETEEELGRACLAAAEELTQSEFGFVDEINAQGKLDSIAISDPGWDACRMEGPEGHGRLPVGLKIDGIYGRVLMNAKGFFTNDPPSHPDSIGVPAGHPPLTAFLGVPLVAADKTIGIVALGNRPGGYGQEHLQALESIAPTMVQALLRKRAEEELRRQREWLRVTLISIGDAVIATDTSGRITFLNPIAQVLTGWPRAEAEGQPVQNVFRIVNEKSREPGEDIIQRVLQDGFVVTLANNTALITRDGREIPIEDSAAPIRDSDGNVSGVVLVFHDVTEKRRAQESLRQSRDELEMRVEERTAELRKTNEELEQRNRDLDDFAHVASHDLQEPLRKIQTFADLLATRHLEAVGDKSRDYLERMRKSARRMQALVLDLLRYSRVTSKQEPFTRFNLRKPIEEAVTDLGVLREETGGRIEVGELHDIEADRVQMRQLFQNLIANGLKYRGEEKPVVRVYSNRSCDAFWEIHVSDNGIGFDECYLEKIFKPFQRLHGNDAPYEGTGMGLAICRRIVERHGGSITATSEPGKGATFIVKLPKKR